MTRFRQFDESHLPKFSSRVQLAYMHVEVRDTRLGLSHWHVVLARAQPT